MTYYQLVQALEALALEAGAASFWAGAKTANGINYNAPFPICEFFNTQPSQLLAGVVRYSIGMGFYGKDEHENALHDSNEGANQVDVYHGRNSVGHGRADAALRAAASGVG